jgi:chromosome segregation ATPase
MTDPEMQRLLFSLDAKLDKLDGRIENLEEKVNIKLDHMDVKIEGACVDREQTNQMIDEIANIAHKAPSFENRLAAAEVRLEYLESQMAAHKEEGIKKKAGIIDGILKAFESSVYIMIGGGFASLVLWLIMEYFKSGGK